MPNIHIYACCMHLYLFVPWSWSHVYVHGLLWLFCIISILSFQNASSSPRFQLHTWFLFGSYLWPMIIDVIMPDQFVHLRVWALSVHTYTYLCFINLIIHIPLYSVNLYLYAASPSVHVSMRIYCLPWVYIYVSCLPMLSQFGFTGHMTICCLFRDSFYL